MNELDAFKQQAAIVGEPFKITAYWPTVILQCQCDAKATVVLIGTGQANACVACHKVYAIVDQMQVRVGLVAAAPVGTVQ